MAATDSAFLKKFESKITVVNRDGGIKSSRDSANVNRRSRGEVRKSAPTESTSSIGGTIHRSYTDEAAQGNAPVPFRPHPLIFSDNEPSLEHLRKITAESKYKNYSTPNSTLVTPHHNPSTNHSTPMSHKSPNATTRSNGHTVTISELNVNSSTTNIDSNVITSQHQFYSNPSHINQQYHTNPIFPPNGSNLYRSPAPPLMQYQYQPFNANPMPNQPSTQAYTMLSNSPQTIPPASPISTLASPTKEQLYFSKQPREVYFKPHNLNDYRKLKEELNSLKMGNLGPDLQSAEYLAKKDQLVKMKEYSKNVRTFHHSSGLPAGPSKLPDSNYKVEKQAAKDKREKAKEYAITIPKPRGKAIGPTNDHILTAGNGQQEAVDDWEDDDLDEDDDEMMIKIMEHKHQAACDNVLQIRKEFGFTQ